MRVPALNIIERLRAHGHVAYLAGGCVRDRLLGLTPKDHDVATDATPTQVQRIFRRTQPVGESFGVVLVYAPDRAAYPGAEPVGDGAGRASDPSPPQPDADGPPPEFVPVEVATFRTDGDYSDGRRPDAVSFSDPVHDAQRRDFTINGLFESPGELGVDPPRTDDKKDLASGPTNSADAVEHAAEAPAVTGSPVIRRLPDGSTVIDHVGGLADLETRTLRAIGEPARRFAEDYLRMLRAVRFAARLNFKIEPTTAAAISDHTARLTEIARERLGDEVRRVLRGPHVGRAVSLLHGLGLAEPLLGRPAEPSWPAGLHDRLDAAADLPTRLAAWWLDLRPGVNPADTVQWRRRLALSNYEHAALRRTLQIAATLGEASAWDELPVAGRKRLLADPRGDQAMLLHRVARLAWPGEPAPDREPEAHALAHDGVGLAPPPLLDGGALIAAGLRPGPAFKTLLDQTYDQQLEGRLKTRQQALAWALEHA